jgi:hypothetical protein
MAAVPINPNDTKNAHIPSPAELDKIINRVNEALKLYDGSRCIYVSPGKLGETQPVRDKVIQMFRQCGWKVDFVPDQREGDAYSFTEAKTYQPDQRGE